MNKEFENYFNTLNDIFTKIKSQTEVYAKAGRAIAEAIARDELIHIIGPGGHSNMAAEEILWRTGGLAPINAILDAGINLIHGARRSNIMERTPGYAKSVLDTYNINREGEILIIANAYGVNAMSIDCALEARERKLTTIGITSTEFANTLSQDHPSRHSSGKNLYEEVDYFINCHLPYGDASIELKGCEQKVGPVSTLCNMFALNLLMIESSKALIDLEIELPLWKSVNMPGSNETNKKLFDKYIPRIKHLN
ncbi:MAG: sugar isomerase domain-containing protein [Bacilli bacterium]